MDEDEFIQYGRLGCEYCVDYLLRLKLPRADYLHILRPFHGLPNPQSLKELESTLKEVQPIDMKSESPNLSYRYRISRNRKNKFFSSQKNPYGDSIHDYLKSYFPNLSYLGREEDCEYWMDKEWLVFTQKFFDIRQFRFRLGDEDEIRFEVIGNFKMVDNNLSTISWILDKRKYLNSVDWSYDLRLKGLKDFFIRKDLFSYRKGLGYVNSCPSNFGRGDRFSLIIFTQKNIDNKMKVETKIWENQGYSISLFHMVDRNQIMRDSIAGWLLSVKNFNFQRKFYFQHTLVPLMLQSSDLLR